MVFLHRNLMQTSSCIDWFSIGF